MKKTYEKILNEKLFFSFPIFKKKLRTISLNTLILENEKKIFVDYLKSNFMYKKETIKIIMEHYRCYIKPKVVGGNFLSILSILISVLLAFVSKDGFDIKSFEISIPYLVSLVFLFLIVYLPLSNITKIRKFFSGEDGMVERLESIFSELYIEYDETINVKNTMKTKKVVLKGKRERLLKEISNSHRS